MYNEDVGVELQDFALSGIYFDPDGNFAGLKLFDGPKGKYVADTPVNYQNLGEQTIPWDFRNFNPDGDQKT